jgi:hypothetical protein
MAPDCLLPTCIFFRTQTLKRLVTYAEKGGALETYKDVPDEIRDELYLASNPAEWDGRTLMLIGGYGVPPKRFPVLRLSFSCRCQ